MTPQSNHQYYEDEELEQALRSSLPILPPHLRGRVLQGCQQRRVSAWRYQRQTRWRWAGAITCAFAAQWLAIAYLDAQRASLLWPSTTDRNTTTLVASAVGSNPSLGSTLQVHSRTLAALLDTRDVPLTAQEVTNVTVAPAHSPIHTAPTVRSG